MMQRMLNREPSIQDMTRRLPGAPEDYAQPHVRVAVANERDAAAEDQRLRDLFYAVHVNPLTYIAGLIANLTYADMMTMSRELAGDQPTMKEQTPEDLAAWLHRWAIAPHNREE